MALRFNGRIEDVLQSHHFRSGEEPETTLHRYVWLCNQQLPQSALGSKTPLQAMKDWHKLKPELFNKQPYYRPGCDIKLVTQRSTVHTWHLATRLAMGVRVLEKCIASCSHTLPQSSSPRRTTNNSNGQARTPLMIEPFCNRFTEA